MTIAPRPVRAALFATVLVVAVALAAVACSVSNEDVEADEFIRPEAPAVAADEAGDSRDAEEQSAGQAADEAGGRR